MFVLSKRALLALYVLLELMKGRGSQSSESLANALGVSVHTLSKVTTLLTRAGWISSVRGAGGGYTLQAAPEQISILQVIELLEGPVTLDRCVRTGERHTADMPCHCGIGRLVREINVSIVARLERLTLSELATAADPHQTVVNLLPIVDGS